MGDGTKPDVYITYYSLIPKICRFAQQYSTYEFPATFPKPFWTTLYSLPSLSLSLDSSSRTAVRIWQPGGTAAAAAASQEAVRTCRQRRVTSKEATRRRATAAAAAARRRIVSEGKAELFSDNQGKKAAPRCEWAEMSDSSDETPCGHENTNYIVPRYSAARL